MTHLAPLALQDGEVLVHEHTVLLLYLHGGVFSSVVSLPKASLLRVESAFELLFLPRHLTWTLRYQVLPQHPPFWLNSRRELVLGRLGLILLLRLGQSLGTA